LGADATSSIAVAQIFAAKQRPTFDPLIVHLYDASQLTSVVSHVPADAYKLMDRYWPGPLTLVLPKLDTIPDLVTASLPGVGVRIPNHPIALELLRAAGCPVAAPSANPFGGISPTTAQHVLDGLGNRIDAVLDGGPCSVGIESTVVSFMGPEPVLLRPGGCPVEDIEKAIGPIQRAESDPEKDDSAQPAPGMLSRHYAPSTRLILLNPGQAAFPVGELRSGLLTYGNQPIEGRFEQIVNLCESEDLQTCAASFFAALRSLDSSGLDVIIAHLFPEKGLGIALNDRLVRAACRD
jgi:L-threonylcarbamoyladenylate synthase